MKLSTHKMDTIFYLTIFAGLLTVVLSGTTYYKGKQKEIEADKSNRDLLEKTNQVVALQGNLLSEMGKTQEKSDTIITLQNKLQNANEQILVLSNKNVKQVLGDGAPTLSAHFYPDKLIALFIQNDNDYPIYDISLVFPNPDTYSSAKKMAESGHTRIPLYRVTPCLPDADATTRVSRPLPREEGHHGRHLPLPAQAALYRQLAG